MVPRRSNGHYSTTTTVFIWDVNASVPQVLDDGGFRYVYGLGRIAEVDGSDNAHYYLADGLGSTMALTDDSGTVENTYAYDPFGAITSSTGSQDNSFTFTGEQTDPSTGLEYLRARYYDPQTGRFVSRDPLNANPWWSGQPFDYVEADPVNSSDPVGLWCPKNPNDCVKGVTDAGNYLSKNGVSIGNHLDRLALGIDVATAAVVDTVSIGYCAGASAIGVLAATCPVFYGAAVALAQPVIQFSNVVSALGTGANCIGTLTNKKEGGFNSENVKDCLISAAYSYAGYSILDPNISALFNVYIVCRDEGKCGP